MLDEDWRGDVAVPAALVEEDAEHAAEETELDEAGCQREEAADDHEKGDQREIPGGLADQAEQVFEQGHRRHRFDAGRRRDGTAGG